MRHHDSDELPDRDFTPDWDVDPDDEDLPDVAEPDTNFNPNHEDEPDDTCSTCGGSGGGPEDLACPACWGSGINQAARDERYQDYWNQL